MNQTLEFQDGLFFNGIDGMSIRVGHQNQETGLLTDVLIYDNRNASGNMTTTVADSGYIRLSDDKRFGDHALQRRTLRTDPKFESVVQQKFPATQ